MSKLDETVEMMRKALKVITLDPKLRDVILLHDPQAFFQAQDALVLYEYYESKEVKA